MGNLWIAHVKTTMKKHKGKSFKNILKLAKKTYKRGPTKKAHKRHHHSAGKSHKKKSRRRRR